MFAASSHVDPGQCCIVGELQEHLQSLLGGAYTLQRELGGGGMSRVFLAEETALGRKVVIKVLAPNVSEELSAERFAREIRFAARLQHPNIVSVLAAGTAGDLSYYTMPFIDGESLRARLARLAPGEHVPLAEAINVLRDVARALAYAHEHGLVHRDVKPENVLISEDAIVVADFGIAKAIDAARTEDGSALFRSTLTKIGTALGTPAYMAPEQASGDPKTDHRADLYAWGMIAYELLAGKHPFSTRTTSHSLVVAQLTEIPAPLATTALDVPRKLAALVTQCVAKNPSDRPLGAREIVHALDEIETELRTPVSTPAVDEGVSRERRAVALWLPILVALALGIAVWVFVEKLTQQPYPLTGSSATRRIDAP